MFQTCFKHVSNGFKTCLNAFQTKTPEKRFAISPLFIWRVTNVATNVGRAFLKILDEEFPKEHVLHKIFNRNTIKISYSCMSNLKQNIDGHNKSILHKKIVPPKTCNCRKPAECPMEGNCLKESVIYQATVTTEDNNPPQTYVGLTENSFKTRYANHKTSFCNSNKRLSTERQ